MSMFIKKKGVSEMDKNVVYSMCISFEIINKITDISAREYNEVHTCCIIFKNGPYNTRICS